MAITTYAELQTAIANWLNRDDLTSIIPDFIRLAEADMQRRLRHYEMEKRATATLDSQYTELPDDFLQPIRLHVQDTNDPLVPMSKADMQDERDRINDTSGQPRYYTITGGEIEVLPTPDGSYTIEMSYYRTLPVLTDGNTSNWLLSAAPDVYLYGSLVQSAPYLAHDERAAVWAGLYQSAIDGVQETSDRAKWGGTDMRVRPARSSSTRSVA